MDDARSCLYTLSKENSISLIYLGPQGQEYIKIAQQSNLYQKAARFADQYGHFVLDERNFEIISLHPLLQSESAIVQLLALTSSGHRLYFSHYRETDPQRLVKGPPAHLVLAFVRPPIGPASSYGYSTVAEGPRGAQIHTSFYASGLLLAANAFSEEMDRVLGICLDSGAMAQVRFLGILNL